MATDPQFASTPVISLAQVATANAARDGTGTVATAIAGSATGRRINKVVIQHTGTSTAGMVRLFLYNGTNTRLFREIPVPAVTASATVPAWGTTVFFGDGDEVILPSATWELRATTNNAETINVITHAADL